MVMSLVIVLICKWLINVKIDRDIFVLLFVGRIN